MAPSKADSLRKSRRELVPNMDLGQTTFGRRILTCPDECSRLVKFGVPHRKQKTTRNPWQPCSSGGGAPRPPSMSSSDCCRKAIHPLGSPPATADRHAEKGTKKARNAPFSRPRWFQRNSAKSFGMNGGDDGTRTRDLCRDSRDVYRADLRES